MAITDWKQRDELFQLLLIRRFEEEIHKCLKKGLVPGTTHLCIGQEAVAVGVCTVLDPEKDFVFSSHRNHGHYIAFTGDMKGLFDEILGLSSGVCGGKGGSQHIHSHNFISNGVQGGLVPIAVGTAFAFKTRKTGGIATVFLGDGTLCEGTTYEAFNIASLWNLPVLFVIEDNQYAQSTHRDRQHAAPLKKAPEAFNIETLEIDIDTVKSLKMTVKEIVSSLRKDYRPRCLLVHTYRLCDHSSHDDCRDAEEVAYYRKKDPLTLALAKCPPAKRESLEQEINSLISTLYEGVDL